MFKTSTVSRILAALLIPVLVSCESVPDTDLMSTPFPEVQDLHPIPGIDLRDSSVSSWQDYLVVDVIPQQTSGLVWEVSLHPGGDGSAKGLLKDLSAKVEGNPVRSAARFTSTNTYHHAINANHGGSVDISVTSGSGLIRCYKPGGEVQNLLSYCQRDSCEKLTITCDL